MNDTSDKMTQATPDTFPGSGNGRPRRIPFPDPEMACLSCPRRKKRNYMRRYP